MNLKRHLNKMKNRLGLVGGPLKLNIMRDAPRNISASIDPRDWHVEITMKKGWDPAADEETASYIKKKGIKDPVLRVLESMLYHEVGHWELPRGSGFGCPGIQMPVNYHDIILDNITSALKASEIDENMVAGSGQTIAAYVANTLEDILDNTNCRRHTGHEGQVIFFNDQGLSNNSTFTAYYEAFVKLNMFMWGDPAAHNLLKRFYTNSEEVKEAVDKVRGLFKQLTWKEPLVRVYEKRTTMRRLYDKEQWGALAHEFTLAMLPLIQMQPPTEQLFGASEEGSTADKKIDQPGEREKIVAGRHKRGDGVSSYMNPFEYLDTLYRHLAKAIPVQTESPSTTLMFPIASYGRERFNPLDHRVEQIEMNRVEIDADGIHLSVSPRYIYTKRGVRRTARGFPKFRLMLLDTSGSMKWAADGGFGFGTAGTPVNPFAPEEELQWGDKSRYHYALLGLYGIELYLEQAGLVHEVQSGLVNFSSKSYYRGMLEHARINEIFKLALTPQFGSTYLSVDEIAQEFGDDAFCMSLSDGAIDNWDEVKEDFKEAISDKIYVHIQIGSSTDFTHDLESWGIPVHYVSSGEDISRLMVDITSATYNSIIKERSAR